MQLVICIVHCRTGLKNSENEKMASSSLSRARVLLSHRSFFSSTYRVSGKTSQTYRSGCSEKRKRLVSCHLRNELLSSGLNFYFVSLKMFIRIVITQNISRNSVKTIFINVQSWFEVDIVIIRIICGRVIIVFSWLFVYWNQISLFFIRTICAQSSDLGLGWINTPTRE